MGLRRGTSCNGGWTGPAERCGTLHPSLPVRRPQPVAVVASAVRRPDLGGSRAAPPWLAVVLVSVVTAPSAAETTGRTRPLSPADGSCPPLPAGSVGGHEMTIGEIRNIIFALQAFATTIAQTPAPVTEPVPLGLGSPATGGPALPLCGNTWARRSVSPSARRR